MATAFGNILRPRKSPSAAGAFTTHFNDSRAVREFLVLEALANTVDGLAGDLLKRQARLFDEVTSHITQGLIELDYEPKGGVDIPPLGHSMHMQAMLYWCARFACTLPELAEAVARCGASPSPRQVMTVLGEMWRADPGAPTEPWPLDAHFERTEPAALDASYSPTEPSPLETPRRRGD